MKNKLLLIFLAMVLVISLGGFAACKAEIEELEALPEEETPSAFAMTGTVPVIVVSGSNYDMGVQYGRQTAARTAHNVAVVKSMLLQWFGEQQLMKDMEVWAYYFEQYTPGIAEWLRGITEGCQIEGFDLSYLDIILLNAFDAEAWTYPEVPYPEETGVSCTSFAASGSATKDGKPIVAVSKMLPRENMEEVILIAFTTDGYSFISNPPSGSVAHNSGVNSNGFAWILTATPQVECAWGIPPVAFFSYLTQFIGSPGEAEEWLASVPRAGATGNFILSDADGYISVFESNAQHFAIRHPGDLGENQFVINTNHFVIEEMKPYSLPWWPDSPYRYATTWEYVSAAAAKGGIDANFTKEMFKSDDWYDPDAKQWHYNDPGSSNCLNNPGVISTSILCPADLTHYIQVGTPSGLGIPAYATGEYVKLELAGSPAEVAAEAGNEAYSLYWAARNSYVKAKNDKAPYLSYAVCASIEEKLDEAILEWQLGLNRAGFATLCQDEAEQLRLWGEALTHYCNAQLYAQMVSSALLELSGD